MYGHFLPLLAACVGGAPDADAPKPSGDSAVHSADSAVDSADSGVGSADSTVDSAVDSGTTRTVLNSDQVGLDGCTTQLCDGGVCILATDLPTVTLSGRAPPADEWALRLTDPRIDSQAYNPLDGSSWGWYTPFGTSSVWLSDSSYSARVFAGTYDVALTYGRRGGSPTRYFPVTTGLVVDADTTLDADLSFHTVQGSLSIGGELLPDAGTLRFEDATTGAWAEVEDGGAWTVELPDGTWDVTFTSDGGQLAIGPASFGSVVVSGGDVTADLTLDAWPVSGTVLLDGLPLEELSESYWRLSFFDEDRVEWQVHLAGGSEWSTTLPPGRYQATVGDQLVGEDIEVVGPTVVALGNAPRTVSGTFRVDGGGPASSWTLSFVDPATGLEVRASGAEWTANLPSSVYDVYLRIAGTDEVGRFLLHEGLPVSSDTLVEVSVATARLSGDISWNGGTASDRWRVAPYVLGESFRFHRGFRPRTGAVAAKPGFAAGFARARAVRSSARGAWSPDTARTARAPGICASPSECTTSTRSMATGW